MIYDIENNRWQGFYNVNGHSCNCFKRITTSSEGELWLAADGGLFTFDPHSLEYSRVSNGRFINIGRHGNEIWTTCLDEKERTILKVFNSRSLELKNQWMPAADQALRNRMYVDDNRIVILASEGVIEFSDVDKSYHFYGAGVEFSSLVLRKLFVRGDELVILTDSSIILFNPENEEWSNIELGEATPPGPLRWGDYIDGKFFLGHENGPIILDEGTLDQISYVADKDQVSRDAGDVVKVDNNSTSPWTRITEEDGLLSNRVFSLFNLNGRVWIGSDVAGLNVIDPDTLKIETYRPDIETGDPEVMVPILEIATDGDSLWHVGYQYYGEFDIKEKTWRKHLQRFAPRGISDAEALWVDKDKVMIGVRKEGVRILDRKSGKWAIHRGTYLDFSPLITDIIKVNSDFFVSMDTGLRLFDPESMKFKFVDVSVFDIQCMIADGDEIWMGARERSLPPGPDNSGIYRFNLRTRHCTSYIGLSPAKGTHVNNIYIDGPFVWIASRQGLERFCRITGSWKHYGWEEGLVANEVLSVVVNGDKLLVGTDNGLFMRSLYAFDDESSAEEYRRAWRMSEKGLYAEAAQVFEKLEDRSDDFEKGHLDYRVAHCYELSGDRKEAFLKYQELMKKYPLLLLELESEFSVYSDYAEYIKDIEKLESSFLEDTMGMEVCRQHLERIDKPLKFMASRMEKSGHFSNAIDYWLLLASRTESQELRDEANKRAQTLTKQHSALE